MLYLDRSNQSTGGFGKAVDILGSEHLQNWPRHILDEQSMNSGIIFFGLKERDAVSFFLRLDNPLPPWSVLCST
jgi:hypothetical protein